MSELDIAGAIAATHISKGDVSTVAVKKLQFVSPLYSHDLVSFYTNVTHVGNSSIEVDIEVYAQRRLDPMSDIRKVGDATFVYVAVDGPGKKRLIPK
jgi:acyl-CoA thioesterase YciA